MLLDKVVRHLRSGRAAATLTLLVLVVLVLTERYRHRYYVALVGRSHHRGTKRPAAGDLGLPLVLPANLPDDLRSQVLEGIARQGYNQYVSDLISVRRRLPDIRDPWCRTEDRFLPDLPPASVVIVFHNEALSVLLRTVHSILDRTAPHLLEEILLVDDYSTLAHTKTFLDEYFVAYPKVRLLRTEQRMGLIRARVLGAKNATADHLVFLDAHCECLWGWLDALLDRVVRAPSVIAVPTIDWINETTLALQHGIAHDLYGSFDWNLSFQWRQRSDRRKRHENPVEPFDTPVMAGGLFCVSREFFARLGWYDGGMDIYGAENMELSFKAWMCGGSIQIVPCSRVAHIQKLHHPYIESIEREREITMRNNLRLAEVWMDEYAGYFYELHPKLAGMRTNLDNIEARKELRRSLRCQSFRWYLEHVFPEQDDPAQSFARGAVRNEGNGLCMNWPLSDRSVATIHCHGLGGHQIWFYTRHGELTREGHCLQYSQERVFMAPCSGDGHGQDWTYRTVNGQFVHVTSGLCLTSDNRVRLALVECDSNALGQKWHIQIVDRQYGGNE